MYTEQSFHQKKKKKKQFKEIFKKPKISMTLMPIKLLTTAVSLNIVILDLWIKWCQGGLVKKDVMFLKPNHKLLHFKLTIKIYDKYKDVIFKKNIKE